MATKKPRVGVLGSGVVGQVLGAGFAGRSHDVMMGTRDPKSDKVTAWVKKTKRAAAGTFAEAAAFGDILVLATLGSAAADAIRLAGEANFAGKVVIDATNPLDFSTGRPQMYVGTTDSAGERIQRALPKAKIVKAFNSVGNAHMIDPDFPGGPPDMFIAGNDEDAKKTVAALCESFGWGVIDVGGIEASRWLEALAMVWIAFGFKTNSWDHAFRLLRKKARKKK